MHEVDVYMYIYVYRARLECVQSCVWLAIQHMKVSDLRLNFFFEGLSIMLI